MCQSELSINKGSYLHWGYNFMCHFLTFWLLLLIVFSCVKLRKKAISISCMCQRNLEIIHKQLPLKWKHFSVISFGTRIWFEFLSFSSMCFLFLLCSGAYFCWLVFLFFCTFHFQYKSVFLYWYCRMVSKCFLELPHK